MKIRWWLIFLLIMGFIVGPKIHNYPGFIIVALDKTTLQMPLWLGAFLSLVALIILYSVIHFIKKMAQSGINAKKWHHKRKWTQSRTKTIAGLLSLIEGRWEESEKKMVQALKHGDTPLVNLLIAAQAANKKGEFNKRDLYLDKAKLLAQGENVVIEISQAKLQYDANQYQTAYETIKQLKEQKVNNPYLNLLEIKVSRKLKLWKNIIQIAPGLSKDKFINSTEIEQFYEEAVIENMQQIAISKAVDEVTKFYNKLSNKIKQNLKVVCCYVEILRKNELNSKAEKLITKALKTHSSYELIEVYSKIKSEQPGKQIDIIESKISDNKDKEKIVHLLINLSIEQKIWGKAKKYLTESILINPTTEKQLQLVGVLSKLGETEAAQKQKNAILELIEK